MFGAGLGTVKPRILEALLEGIVVSKTVSHTNYDGAGSPLEVPVLYEDTHCVVVDKPAGMLVHRSELTRDTGFLLQHVRNMIGQHIYPVHRLDRPTSGVVLFGKTSAAARSLRTQFDAHHVQKLYVAIVRGFVSHSGMIDSPVKDPDSGIRKDALTRYHRLACGEIPVPVGPYQTARYSLVAVIPRTGRRHQIRLHMAHISHPIVGDVWHGDGKHNRMYRERYGLHRLMLFAMSLRFRHPETAAWIRVRTTLPMVLHPLFQEVGWNTVTITPGTTVSHR